MSPETHTMLGLGVLKYPVVIHGQSLIFPLVWMLNSLKYQLVPPAEIKGSWQAPMVMAAVWG